MEKAGNSTLLRLPIGQPARRRPHGVEIGPILLPRRESPAASGRGRGRACAGRAVTLEGQRLLVGRGEAAICQPAGRVKSKLKRFSTSGSMAQPPWACRPPSSTTKQHVGRDRQLGRRLDEPPGEAEIALAGRNRRPRPAAAGRRRPTRAASRQRRGQHRPCRWGSSRSGWSDSAFSGCSASRPSTATCPSTSSGSHCGNCQSPSGAGARTAAMLSTTVSVVCSRSGRWRSSARSPPCTSQRDSSGELISVISNPSGTTKRK